MRVSEIRVKRIRVNQGLGVVKTTSDEFVKSHENFSLILIKSAETFP